MERERARGPGGSYLHREGGGRNLENEFNVVAMGAGTAHRPSAEVAHRPAQALNDCHAEILSRRAFVKYLLGELDKARVATITSCSEGGVAAAEESIFCRSTRGDGGSGGRDPPFVLKPVRVICMQARTHTSTHARMCLHAPIDSV